MGETSPMARQAAELSHNELIVWFTTTSRDLSPQPRPVWFIWHEGQFLIYSRPETNKVLHVGERPLVSLNFNADRQAHRNVFVFKGKARIAPEIPPAHELPAYVEKYEDGIRGLGMTPEEFGQAYSTPILVEIEELEGRG